MNNKRGISPVVATVLLIVVVLVLATAIFIWAISTVEEAIIKNGSPISQVCDEVSLTAGLSGNQLRITNTGDVAIEGVQVETESDRVDCIGEGADDTSMAPGGAIILDTTYCPNAGTPTSVYPILLGRAEDGTDRRAFARRAPPAPGSVPPDACRAPLGPARCGSPPRRILVPYCCFATCLLPADRR